MGRGRHTRHVPGGAKQKFHGKTHKKALKKLLVYERKPITCTKKAVVSTK